MLIFPIRCYKLIFIKLEKKVIQTWRFNWNFISVETLPELEEFNRTENIEDRIFSVVYFKI